MNIKEVVISLSAIVCLLVFMIFMMNLYNQRQYNNLTIKNLKLDSVIVEEQKELIKKDSIILAEQKIIREIINSNSESIKRAHNQIYILKNDTNRIYSIK